MEKSVEINKKIYLPSSVLAKKCKYSSDYISKIAREEKILATQIGRQWYVEPESLKLFLLQVEVEKKHRRQELQLKRKQEQKISQEEYPVIPDSKTLSFVAMSQTFVILLCGVLVGGLGLIVFNQDLDGTDILYGAKQLEVAILNPTISTMQLPELTHNPVAMVVDSLLRDREESYTNLPVFPEREHLSNNINQEILNEKVSMQFSDEVIIYADTEEVVMVRPVFKNQETEGQVFRIVPTTQ